MNKRTSTRYATLGIALIALLLVLWLVILIKHNEMALLLVSELWKWLKAPHLNFAFINLSQLPLEGVAWAELLIVGTVAAHRIFPTENNLWLKRLFAAVSGLGITGVVSMLLAIVGQLTFVPLNLALLLVTVLLLWRPKASPREMVNGLFRSLSLWKFTAEDFPKGTRVLVGVCALFFVVMLYHTLSMPIVEWDSLIYHAAMPRLIFENHGIPLIVGTSVGIEMSANYPPLYPVLGAYFYTQTGIFNETYLQLISPFASLLTLMATYQIGLLLGNRRYGVLAVIFLLITPLYFYRSIVASYYLLLLLLMTSACLFLLLAYIYNQWRYWIAFGLTYSFALLTSHHAVTYLPSIGLIGAYLLVRCPVVERRALLTKITASLGLAVSVGAIWYVRNWIVVGNPVYPLLYSVFGGLQLDATMLKRSQAAVYNDSLADFYETTTPNVIQFLTAYVLNRVQFPAFSLISLFGLMFIPRRSLGRWLLVLVFIVSTFLLTATAIINIFQRYFLMFLPQAALLLALVVVTALELVERRITQSALPDTIAAQVKSSFKARLTRLGIALAIVLCAVFPGSTALLGGASLLERSWTVFRTYKLFLNQPSGDVNQALDFKFNDALAWQWLVDNVQSNERIGLVEYRIYPLLNAKNTNFFSFDGSEARTLQNLSDPDAIVRTLRQAGVSYILDHRFLRTLWSEGKQFPLPLTKYFGDRHYFPTIYSTFDAKIYYVGARDDLSLANATSPVNFSVNGWSQAVTSPDVRTLPPDSDGRLYVKVDRSAVVQVEYLDSGSGTVDASITLVADTPPTVLQSITLENTQQWKTVSIPLDAAFLGNYVDPPYDLTFTTGMAGFSVRDVQVLQPSIAKVMRDATAH